MRKLILIAFVLLGLAAGAQQTCWYAATTRLATVNVATLSGADTTIYFQFPNTDRAHAYSVQVHVSDTIETAALGVYLKATNYSTYTEIADSLSIAATTFPQAKYFAGDSFPFKTGAVTINKNGATEGTVQLYVTAQ